MQYLHQQEIMPIIETKITDKYTYSFLFYHFYFIF